MSRLEKEIVPSALEEDLLTLLNGKSLYGVEIMDAVEQVSEGKRTLRPGSLYTTLHRLEKKMLVEPRWGQESDGKPGGARRKYYRLTALGQAILQATNCYRRGLAEWEVSPSTSNMPTDVKQMSER